MEKEAREIVWLPKSIADKVKDIDSVQAIEAEILKYVENIKSDTRVSIEGIDDDIVQFRAAMIKARNSFKQAKEEELTSNYELWEKFENDLIPIRNKIQSLRDEIKPLKTDLEALRKDIDGVSSWQVKELLENLEKIRSLMYGESGSILKFLFENYKKPKTE